MNTKPFRRWIWKITTRWRDATGWKWLDKIRYSNWIVTSWKDEDGNYPL